MKPNPKDMTNDIMLDLIRLDNPHIVIHKVKTFSYNKVLKLYSVEVDMQVEFLGIIVKHALNTLPYPFKIYENLTLNDQLVWEIRNHY